MNETSRVNSLTAPRNNSISQVTICAAIACAVIYAPLCVVLVAIGGLSERVLSGGLGGCLFWIVIWIIGSVLIEKTGKRTARVIATGSVYGAIVGLASGLGYVRFDFGHALQMETAKRITLEIL